MINRIRIAIWSAIAALCSLAMAPLAAEPVAPDWMTEDETARIVAIGDLHGDHRAFRAIAQAAGLINADGAWVGGDTIFVQIGDVPGRGPDSYRIFQDLMRLQGEAALVGGSVTSLIGNHESMNVIGDQRYVHPGEYAAFETPGSDRFRRRYYRDNQQFIERAYRRMQGDLSEDQIRRLWLRNTPLGGAELLEAFGPEGEIGRWLARNPAVLMIDGNLFVHGGLSRAYAGLSIEEINRRVSAAIVQRDNSSASILIDADGPLWYRGYFLRGEEGDLSLLPPEDAEPEVDTVLAAFGAERVIVGHTPSLGGIRILLGGKLINIDTGISARYGGVWSYLEIQGDSVVAHIVTQGGNQ